MREDPSRGFYVSGLNRFAVRNYGEAIALVNRGLENRKMAPTLMNTTSSRSHTIITIEVEQRTQGPEGALRTKKSKLMFVDLAGR
jgi:hypothetical protein